MSGIAGIIRFDGGPVERERIAKITGAMSYRGPDGIHHWIDGSVALGHCMLRTTPESLEEHQPLTNEDQSLVLVMDGRLDNREDLKQELWSKKIQLRSHTDAELVLGAYQLWGGDSPRHLLGDFAFAVWDAGRGRLFCARDHFGVKPFYYFCGDDFLAFASDEEAFFGLPGIQLQPNEKYILSMFLPELYNDDYHHSWLKNIEKLLPAKSLTVNRAGRKTLATYWQLQPLEEYRLTSDDDYQEEFRSIFDEAVRCRMRSVGNLSLMLSGGIDSAAIAASARVLIKELPNLELHTFSAVLDEAATCVETSNIQHIVKGHEQYAHLIPVPGFGEGICVDDPWEAAWTRAHPSHNWSLFQAIMYLAASRSGSRVMYDGMDGDIVTYVSNFYISRLLRLGAWREAWTEARGASVNNTYLKDKPALAILARNAKNAFVPTGVKRFKRRIQSMIHGNNEIRGSLINREFATSMQVADRLRDQHARAVSIDVGGQQEHIDLISLGSSSGMEAYDAVAARYGIEPRHPWSDKRLAEFFVRLPRRQKVRDGWTKYLVRGSMAPLLGEHIAWHREKRHLGHRFRFRLLQDSHEHIMNTLGAKGCRIEKYLDATLVSSLLSRYHANSNWHDLDEIYSVMSMELWLRRVERVNEFEL